MDEGMDGRSRRHGEMERIGKIEVPQGSLEKKIVYSKRYR